MEFSLPFCYDTLMYDSFLAELLVLGMICITCLRMFFTKRARIDAVAILAPLAFLISLLSLWMWGAEVFLVLTAALALLVLLTNVRALFRLSSRLYVDHYSILFVSFSLFELLAALALALLATIFHPVQYRPADFGVEKKSWFLTGSLATGYQVRSRLFEPSRITGTLYQYSPLAAKEADDTASKPEALPVVLLMPKSTASAVHYEPYCLMLAQKGYTVLTADFTAGLPSLYGAPADRRIFRRAYSVHRALSDKEAAQRTEKEDAAITARCYDVLTTIALALFGPETQVYYSVDALGIDLLNELVNHYEQNVLGFYAMNRVAEYTTSGYGFVEQTDPYTAFLLGSRRDKSFFIPRYVAGKTDESIKETLKLLHPVEIIRASGAL